jgi:hypothetical protein
LKKIGIRNRVNFLSTWLLLFYIHD